MFDLHASIVLLRRMLVVFFVLTSPTSMKAKPHCMTDGPLITSFNYLYKHKCKYSHPAHLTECNCRQSDKVEIIHISLEGE